MSAVFLVSACAVTPQQAAQMSDYKLCAWQRQDQAIYNEIRSRDLHCPRVIRKHLQPIIESDNSMTLCLASYKFRNDPNIDLVYKEIKKRKLDCPDMVARYEQLQQRQQQAERQAIANQLNAAAEENRRNEEMLLQEEYLNRAQQPIVVPCVPVGNGACAVP